VSGRLDAFGARVLPADARERKCIHCGDAATHGDLCYPCITVTDIASEHPRACACGPCLVFTKIDARRVAVRS